MYKILIADDERKLRETMRDYLVSKGFQIVLAPDGEAALTAAFAQAFDLIILDVMMPGINGIEACREIRRQQNIPVLGIAPSKVLWNNIPVLFLSALGEEEDLLAGYAVGADDYIVKPFPLSVLSQKSMAIIRRSKRVDQEHRLTGKGIVIDLIRKQVYVEGEEVSFSSKDFRLLAYLMENRDVVLEREIILSRIWGYDFEGDTRVVDTHIKRIRKLLGDHADCIKTVIGSGYVYREE